MNALLGHGNGEKISGAVGVALTALSALALAIVFEAVVELRTYRPADEDWHAHAFQLLVVLQLPLTLYLGVSHRRSPLKLMPVLAPPLGFLLVAFATIHYFSL